MKILIILNLFPFLIWDVFCQKNNLIETSCFTSKDCTSFIVPGGTVESTCVNGQCLCVNGKTKPVDCIPVVSSLTNQIGGKCPCPIKNAICLDEDNICLCAHNFTASADKRRCLKKSVTLGSECENDNQCSSVDPFSHCVNKNCSCVPRFTVYSGICYSLSGLKDSCKTDAECESDVKNSVCLDDKCLCKRGFVTTFDRTECLANAKYNELCKNDAQCKVDLGPGGYCIGKKCSCGEDYYHIRLQTELNETRSICELKKSVGDMCSKNEDCYNYKWETNFVQQMECFLAECICRAGHDQVGHKCYLKSTASIQATFLSLFWIIGPSVAVSLL